jgi:hypothetical protein
MGINPNIEQQSWQEQQEIRSRFESQFSEWNWYADFVDFFSSLDVLKQTEFFRAYDFSKDNSKLQDFLDKEEWEWFPLDDKSFQNFIVKFGQKSVESWSEWESISVKKKGEVARGTIDSFQKFDNHLSDLFIQYPDLSKELEFIEDPKTEEDFEYNKKLFEEHYGEFLDAAEKRSSQEFLKLYKTFESYQSDWTFKLTGFKEKYENKYIVNRYILKQNNPHGLKYKDMVENFLIPDPVACYKLQIEGDTVTYNDQVLDVWVYPPKRFIKWKNSFRLQSSTINTEYFKGRIEHLRRRMDTERVVYKNKVKINEIDGKIASFRDKKWVLNWFKFTEANLDSLYRVYTDKYIQDFIREELDDDRDNVEKQNALIFMISKFIDFQVSNLTKEKDDFISKNNVLQDELQRLDGDEKERVWVYVEGAKKKDEKTRKSMKILHALWIDELPQGVFDNIIGEINGNGLLRWSIDLWGSRRISRKIDLSEWEFWQTSWENYKEIAVRLFNKILTWNPDKPHDVEWFVSGTFTWVKERNKFKQRLNASEAEWWFGIIWAGGGFNIQKVRENLGKTIDSS